MGTKFSFEVPLAHLEEFDEYQQYAFALSFLCRDEGYFNYLVDCKKRGKWLILDNSYNELKKADEPKELAYLYRELGADLVICPDDDNWTVRELEEAYKEMTSLVPREKVLLVVKSEEEYDWYLGQGGSKFCTTYEQRPWLRKNILHLSYHFLGLLNPWEISRFSPASCDTGMPIKLALEGKTMKEWVLEGCPHPRTHPEYFNLVLTQEQIHLAKENIKWTVNLAP